MKKSILILALLASLALIASTPRLPTQWTIFEGVPKDYVPDPSELETIPVTFGGVAGRRAEISENGFDMAEVFGERKPLTCYWLFAQLESDSDCGYSLGIGADWWFACNLNGMEIFSTMQTGNVLSPPSVLDYVLKGRLRKGTNTIAVKFVSGSYLSVIKIAGELELDEFLESPEIRDIRGFYARRGVPLKTESTVAASMKEMIAERRVPQGFVVDSNWNKLLLPWTTTLVEKARTGADNGAFSVLSADMDGRDMVVSVRGTPPLSPDERVYAVLRTEMGAQMNGRIGTLEELGADFADDGTATVRMKDFHSFLYGAPAKVNLEVGVVDRKGSPEYFGKVELGGRPFPGERAVLRLEETTGGATPMLNGKPFFFNELVIHPFIPRRTLPTGMEGYDSPFNVVASRFGGNAASENWWYGPEKYDFTCVDWQICEMIDQYPDSKIGIYLFCHPGQWYGREYPDRLSQDERGDATQNYYLAKVRFSDPDVRADAAKAVAAFVAHCEKYFGGKIVLYNLMGGISCEWQGWNCQDRHFADYSPGELVEFRKYAESRGLRVDRLPTPEERRHSSGGTFRTPKEDSLAVLYDEFYSKSIADFINLLARTVKENCSGDKLVGAYYGYHMEYSNMGNGRNKGGHNMTGTLLESPYVDFLISPQSYSIRTLGAPNGEMKPYGSLKLAGKLSMIEDDTRTHLIEKSGQSQALNLDQTLKVLTRNAGMYLCHRSPINELGVHGGNEFDAPEIRGLFGKILKAGQFIMEQNRPDPVEVAFVVDEGSIMYFSDDFKTATEVDEDDYRYSYTGDLVIKPNRSFVQLSGESIGNQRFMLARFGAPADVILLEDVARNAARYKLVVFLNAYRDSEALRQAVTAVRNAGSTAVFTYGAGFIDEEGFSGEKTGDLIGMDVEKAGPGSLRLEWQDGHCTGADYRIEPRFAVTDSEAIPLAVYADDGTPAVARKGRIVFYGGAALDVGFIRSLAREAGAHIYVETGDNLYAGASCISIHALCAGDKRISLPGRFTVVDAISGETLAEDADSFTVRMDAMDSRIFLLK